MGRSFGRAIGKFAVAVLLVLPLVAQQNGAISGIVTDPSGAVVANAAVTLKNDLSNDSRKTVSNSEGFFSFASVPSGTYTVSIDAKGFKTLKKTGIILNLGDQRTLTSLRLEVGSTTTEAVTVIGEAENLTTVDSGEKSTVLNFKQMDSVSIVGQNAADFIKIMPGMAMSGDAAGNVQNQASYTGEKMGVGAGPIGNFSANGTRTGAMDIVSDGAHIIDPGCNCGQATTMITDSMEEVKVLTSNFSAENQKGPVVITGVTKAGGQNFHGEVYFYARNYNLNTNDWYFNQAGLPKPQSTYYYPGFNLGGPVLIPGTGFNKKRNKLFFFVNYEHYTQNIDNGALKAFVPTQAMRGGDFSPSALAAAGLNIPATSGWFQITGSPSAFPGGIIPANQFDKTGAGILNLLPLPNANPAQTGGYNFVSGNVTYSNGYQLNPRIDIAISENTKLYVSYRMQRESGNRLTTLWWGNTQDVPYPTQIVDTNNSDVVSANLTHVFSPTFTNEFIFSFTNLDLPNSFSDPSKIDMTKLGLQYKNIFGNPETELPEYTGWGGGVATMLNPSGFQLTGSLYARKKLPTVADNISKVWDTHTIKAGFYWEKTGNNQPSNNNVNGQMVFAQWGSNTSGNAYADTLLGRVAQYSESNKDTILALAYHPIQFYVQDSWKVTRRFTLDYGIRFDHLSAWYDENGTGLAVWNAAKYNASAPATALTGLVWHAIDPSIPLSGVPTRPFFYSPRFGMAWDILGNGKTVIRGGWGMYRYHDEQNVQSAALGITQGSYTFCANNCNGVQISQIGSYTPSTVIPGSIGALQLGDDQQPLTKSYSFTISQRAPWKSTLEASYVGNQSSHLNNWNTSLFNINAIPIGAEFAGGQWSNSPNTQDFRPFQNYQTVSVAQHSLWQNYNGLQVSWNKQSGRFNFMTNYTFSKVLGVRLWSNAASNVGLGNNYGPMAADRTHIFNVAYVYQMPNLLRNRVAGTLVNGWQISGISQIQSGQNLQATVSANMNFTGVIPAGTLLPNGQPLASDTGMSNQNLLGTPDVQLEPFVTCNPASGLHTRPGTFGQYINPNCFAAPTIGHNGTYDWPYVKGPYFMNHDLSLFKNFKFTEQRQLQFRFMAYNFLNHAMPSFLGGDPALNLNMNSLGQVSNQNFGTVTEKLGHRVIQMAVKFYF
jgi:hypothetical protein